MKKRIDPKDVTFVRYHDSLSEVLVDRIKRLHPIVNEVIPMSLEEWIDGFNYDMHPEQEVQIWERMMELLESRSKMQGARTKEEKERIFRKILEESGAGEMVISKDDPASA